MELLEGIMTTRAIRRYTGDAVTDDEITTCLRAAVQAPNNGNIQPWQFLVITDADTKRAVGEIYRRSYERFEPAMLKATPPFRSDAEAQRHARTLGASRDLARTIGDAPAMVAFLMPDISLTLSDDDGPLDIGTLHASIFPAVQNFILAARSLGIGTALTTVFRVYQSEMRAALGVPDRYEIVALVPMGRPKGHFGIAPRRPAEAYTHWNRFGEKRPVS